MRATPNSETVKKGNFRAFINLILKIFSANFQVEQEKKITLLNQACKSCPKTYKIDQEIDNLDSDTSDSSPLLLEKVRKVVLGGMACQLPSS